MLDRDSIEKQPLMTTGFHLNSIDASWQPTIQSGLNTLDPDYLQQLRHTDDWLPGRDNIFNAFSLPLDKVNYVLFGESPYPRAQSANGYAFWDAAVSDIWSPTGLSKAVNRATSLRNIIKMLLIAEGLLTPNHTSQTDIANVNKTHLVKTNSEFFGNFIQHGILLLNATLVLQPSNVRKDARAWRPFLKHTMDYLLQNKPDVQFILLGNIANEIDPLITQPGVKKFYAEHPYNISFINNPEVLAFFKPLHLLRSK
jgi:uracil-DNA glycosylase